MYSRIRKLRDICLELDTRELYQMMYSIDVFFEAEIYKIYERVLRFCIEHNISRIYDIGCAYGLQSEVFLESSVDYVGIDENSLDFWNKDRYRYIVGHYPFSINVENRDLAVSSLCLGWNRYLYEGEKTLHEQFKALSRDFNHCLIYMPKDRVKYVSKYFSFYEIVEDLVYFKE